MRRILPITVLAGLLGGTPAGAQQAESVALDLNRLDAVEGGCQVYMIGRNNTGRSFTTLQTDLVTFGPEGVVNGRIVVELAPMPAGKTVLRLFVLPETACEGVGRVLLNEVPRCEDASGPVEGCTALIQPSSRAGTEFFK